MKQRLAAWLRRRANELDPPATVTVTVNAAAWDLDPGRITTNIYSSGSSL